MWARSQRSLYHLLHDASFFKISAPMGESPLKWASTRIRGLSSIDYLESYWGVYASFETWLKGDWFGLSYNGPQPNKAQLG